MAGFEMELCGCPSDSMAPCRAGGCSRFPVRGASASLYLLSKNKSQLHWYFLMLSHESANQTVQGMLSGDIAQRASCAINLQIQRRPEL